MKASFPNLRALASLLARWTLRTRKYTDTVEFVDARGDVTWTGVLGVAGSGLRDELPDLLARFDRLERENAELRARLAPPCADCGGRGFVEIEVGMHTYGDEPEPIFDTEACDCQGRREGADSEARHG
jgi:hypothetical protein